MTYSSDLGMVSAKDEIHRSILRANILQILCARDYIFRLKKKTVWLSLQDMKNFNTSSTCE